MDSLDQITAPIRRAMTAVKKDLLRSVRRLTSGLGGPIPSVGYFFNKPGKFLRPMLVLLAAGAASGGKRRFKAGDKTLLLASVVEFIHAASLIHDDILDSSRLRRGRPTVNRKFGVKAAVLAGDLLYVDALRTCSRMLPSRVNNILIDCVQGMCGAEAVRLTSRGRLGYIDLVRRKTANLMSVSCGCAAILAGAGRTVSDGLFRFGLNFGMAYQFLDDGIDGDAPFSRSVLKTKAEATMKKAFAALSALPDSSFRDSLLDFGKHILSLRSN